MSNNGTANPQQSSALYALDFRRFPAFHDASECTGRDLVSARVENEAPRLGPTFWRPATA